MTIKKFLKGFSKGVKEFNYLHTIVNLIVLTFVYIFGIGFTLIIARFNNKKFLEVEITKNKDSYWSDLNLKKQETEKYLRQF